jgi:hypothetical protein
LQVPYDKTRKMVEEHFKEDIELFDYTFDSYYPEVGQIPDNLAYLCKQQKSPMRLEQTCKNR